ncbi:MAG: hypothetical protein RI894_1520 [Bacteroidota bacterium]|jgi:nitroreductase
MILNTIQTRRSVFPKNYNEVPVARETIEQLLEAANAAPSHKRTEPWRFTVFYGEGRVKLADFLSDFYKESTEAALFSEFKYKKMQENALKSSAVIAIVQHTSGLVPEIEETCAVACAVENMWLAAHALGVGAYWSTGGPTFHQATRDFLSLAANEKCLGFFYIGNHDLPEQTAIRGDIAEKTVWVLG